MKGESRKPEYTGWDKLPGCDPNDGHVCREWTDWMIDELRRRTEEEDELILDTLYIEAAVPEDKSVLKDDWVAPRLLVVGSSGSRDTVRIFLGGTSITVNAEMLANAMARVVGT